VTDPKTPAEQAVEMIIYAPIGFALEARKLLPTFVDRGRQQVQMARMIGKFAVGQGQIEAGKRLSRAQTQAQRQANAILGELGLTGDDHAADKRDTVISPVSSPSSATPDHVAPSPTPGTAVQREQASAASSELAIAEYDSLAASQVIPRLNGLGADELEALRVYESGHRGRKTILGRIAQLQGE